MSHARSLIEHMDSAALALELEQWGPAPGLTVARIFRDSIGGPSASVSSQSLDEAGQERLEEMLERHTRVVPNRDDPLALEVGTSTGVAPRRLAALQTCPPTVLNRRDIQRGISRAALRLEIVGTARITAWLFVRGDGTVGQARIYRGSGDAEVDGALLDVMRGALFSPARLEGIPLNVWVQIPVNATVEEPPPPPEPEPPFFPPMPAPLPPPPPG